MGGGITAQSQRQQQGHEFDRFIHDKVLSNIVYEDMSEWLDRWKLDYKNIRFED